MFQDFRYTMQILIYFILFFEDFCVMITKKKEKRLKVKNVCKSILRVELICYGNHDKNNNKQIPFIFPN